MRGAIVEECRFAERNPDALREALGPADDDLLAKALLTIGDETKPPRSVTYVSASAA